MADIFWPAIFPQLVLRQGYTEEYVDVTYRIPMSVGFKALRVDTAIKKKYTVLVSMDDVQKEQFFAFWSVSLSNGTIPFIWSKFTAPGTPATYKFTSDPTADRQADSGRWNVTMKLIDA